MRPVARLAMQTGGLRKIIVMLEWSIHRPHPPAKHHPGLLCNFDERRHWILTSWNDLQRLYVSCYSEAELKGKVITNGNNEFWQISGNNSSVSKVITQGLKGVLLCWRCSSVWQSRISKFLRKLSLLLQRQGWPRFQDWKVCSTFHCTQTRLPRN